MCRETGMQQVVWKKDIAQVGEETQACHRWIKKQMHATYIQRNTDMSQVGREAGMQQVGDTKHDTGGWRNIMAWVHTIHS